MELKLSADLKITTNAIGQKEYCVDIQHEGLKKHRSIRSTSMDFMQVKALLQLMQWNLHADLSEGKAQKISERKPENWLTVDQQRRFIAEGLTEDIQVELRRLETILVSSLRVTSNVFDWESSRSLFHVVKESAPVMSDLPSGPSAPWLPGEPSRENSFFQPHLGLMDKLISSRKQRKIAEAEARYQSAHDQWSAEIEQKQKAHADEMEAYLALGLRLENENAILFEAWKQRGSKAEANQTMLNRALDERHAAYLASDPDAISDYCDLVLLYSSYPDFFPQDYELDYDQKIKQLVIDYALPAPDDMPKIKGIKWIASRGVFEEQKLSESASEKLYDEVVYQVVLRTAHELFDADKVGALESIVVNGMVTSIDRGSGKLVTACILSLRVGVVAFNEINLSQVDPKTCFKALKGVGSSKLHGLSPVPPIMPLRRDDSRFVAAYEVANTLDDSVNLASMDWEDFEHLIRELFEKEFSSTGGEVRVTQASRDGGVDAVAFDPDPIRGGKIVIQAKRYTNTVGVSAVRDLYGTVLNEGATKGILVTTSDYGPDSYNFAQGKPLVLLSGGNLLHMLEKHGHKARIDIREAKKLNASQHNE